ncbi:protocadherin-11 X-linked-like [Sycon ciliatum]|uniref:protocadherin-11 X-linked-like n=1 Tax=Sycon ciliatum TaxID=27933 RepID=UPI0031F6EA98
MMTVLGNKIPALLMARSTCGVLLMMCLSCCVTVTRVAATCRRVDDTSQAGPGVVCRLACRVPEERPVNTTIVTVGQELQLDLLTITWSFEITSETSNSSRALRVAVNEEDGALILQDTVDYESKPTPVGVTRLVVMGTPIATSQPLQILPDRASDTTCTVDIEIVDIDDNQPRVDSSFPRSLTVREDMAVGTTIAILPIVDEDSGVLGQWVIERIPIGTGQDVVIRDPAFRGIGTFDINNHTGEIRLISELDAETQQVYGVAFIILPVVRDPLQPFPATEIMVFVEDVDEFAPVIEISPLIIQNITFFPVRDMVREALPVSQIVFQATVTDRDVDSNTNFTVHNAFGDFYTERVFPTSDVSWFLRANVNLDRETRSQYNLTLLASDTNPNNTLHTSTNFTVSLIDSDDNRPEFSQELYEARLVETTLVGSPVLQLQANDPDLRDYVSYKLDSILVRNRTGQQTLPASMDINSVFNINSTTGLVTLGRRLDFEELGSVTFLVVFTAISSRNPSNNGTSTALITLYDANDEAPTFLQTHYTFQVAENGEGQEPVGQLEAVDRDPGKNGKVLYSIEDTARPDESREFSVHPDTGLLLTVGGFDRETQASYSFLAVATDDAEVTTDRLSGVAQITVIITDQDDNPPVFTNPPAEILVGQESAQGQLLWQFNTTDADTTPSEVSFRVSSQKNSQSAIIASHFTMSNDGRLTTRRSLATLSVNVYTVLIHVQETNVPTLSSTVQVNLNVTVTAPPEASTGSSGIDLTTIIIVIACAALLLIIIAVLLVYVNIKRKKRSMAIIVHSQPSKNELIFQNNISEEQAYKTPHYTHGPRPASLVIGSTDSTTYMNSSDLQGTTPRSDPDGSAFTPGSFTEAPFSVKSRIRSGIYEPGAASDNTPCSKESSRADWDRRMSVRTASTMVEEGGSVSSCSSAMHHTGNALSTVEPSPDIEHARQRMHSESSDGHSSSPPTLYSTVGSPGSQRAALTAAMSASPRIGQGRRRVVSESYDGPRSYSAYAESRKTRSPPSAYQQTGSGVSRSALSNPEDRRSPMSSRSHSVRYSSTPPSSAQGTDPTGQTPWQPVCYKAPIAASAAASPLVGDLAPVAAQTGYKASPIRQHFTQNTIEDTEQDDTESSAASDEQCTDDEMRFYPSGLRPQNKGAAEGHGASQNQRVYNSSLQSQHADLQRLESQPL